MTVSYNSRKVREAISDISEGFDWKLSSQGWDYWQSVQDNLYKVQREKPGSDPAPTLESLDRRLKELESRY